MGCGGSKPPDATDASASDESFKDPTAAAEALENDAPPVSRSPGATSASEVAVAAEAMATGSYKNRRASAPANLKPLPEDKAEGSGRRSRRRSLGTLVSKKTEVEATEGEMVRKGKKGAAPPPPVKHSFEWE